jgi:hypothetical protein
MIIIMMYCAQYQFSFLFCFMFKKFVCTFPMLIPSLFLSAMQFRNSRELNNLRFSSRPEEEFFLLYQLVVFW